MDGSFRYDLIPRGARVLCALSGGADSMYLLCRLLEGAREGGYTLCCAHYNHRLRDTAQRDEDFVTRQCARLGVPLTLGGGDVAEEAARSGESVETCARRLRYEFLRDTAHREECTLIATGHHAGDNGETVLMNLIRGSGLKGLCGIPERQGDLVRPMLRITREEILLWLEERGIPHVEDESNLDPRYTRNRVRLEVLPILEQLNPRAVRHIGDAALRLREDEAFLSQLAAGLLKEKQVRGGEIVIPAAVLGGAPGPLALRACGMLAREAGLSARAVHLEGILALCRGDDPSARLDVPGGAVFREYALTVFSPGGKRPPGEEVPLSGEVLRGGWRVTCQRAVCPQRPMWIKPLFTSARRNIPSVPAGREIASGWGKDRKRRSKN